MEKNKKKVLLIGDFLSTGNMGGSLCEDVLSFYSLDVDFVPTALISNPFSIRPIEISNTSTYLKNTLEVFKKQEKNYDCIFIGFVEKGQEKIIKDFLKDTKIPIILDPIMGDNGSLYKSLDESIIEVYKSIVEFSDIILPNQTEAGFLTENRYERFQDMVDYFYEKDKKLIITGVKEDNGHFIYAKDNEPIKEEFTYIPQNFGGSGDLFDSLFIVAYLKGFNLKDSIKKAKDMTSKILQKQVELFPDKNDLKLGEILKVIS